MTWSTSAMRYDDGIAEFHVEAAPRFWNSFVREDLVLAARQRYARIERDARAVAVVARVSERRGRRTRRVTRVDSKGTPIGRPYQSTKEAAAIIGKSLSAVRTAIHEGTRCDASWWQY